jgi:hypothetical protein
VESEHLPSEAPSTVPSVFAERDLPVLVRALARTLFTVLLRAFARALVPALCRVDRRNTAPVSARPGSLSSAFLAPFPRLLLTLVESEQVPSEAPRSMPSDSASPSAVWQCSFERSHEHWSQLYAEWIAETGTSFEAK